MTRGGPRRFGVLLNADAPPAAVIGQFRLAEALGFDQVFVPDHLGDYRDSAGPWFDGWTLLAAGATATERVRIGTLVANPILRPPALMAKAAVTVDHLSGGRLELGVGTGILDLDHHAVGGDVWSVKERVARFAEYVAIVDGVLRGAGEPFSFDGHHLRARDVPTAPAPVQRPRPPLIVGGHAPAVLRVAAQYADVWNTNGRWGGGVAFDAPFADVVAVVAERSRRLDEICAEVGRDPASLRRSLLVNPNEDGFPVHEIVASAVRAGIDDFVFGWPPAEGVPAFEKLAVGALPRLRGGR